MTLSPATAVDLNCDLGEGVGDDAAVMPFITSANVACGAHAGDLSTMRATVAAAVAAGVAIGAHPSYVDRANFGRKAHALSPTQIFDLIGEQLEALGSVVREHGTRLSHVKPHGALYHVAASDPAVADAIARAVGQRGDNLIVVGAPGSALAAAAARQGLRFAGEIFADRGYGDDGRLLPRGQPGARLSLSPQDAAARAVTMFTRQVVVTHRGLEIPQAGATICLHGDEPDVIARAQALHAAFRAAGVTPRALAAWL
ncbi:MAG TPA: 5-oxoprolinase subunit PxpA [Polyangia bacterium]